MAIYTNDVREGMDVVDVNDHKIGSVERVSQATTDTVNGGYIEVSTGFLGLGEKRYIPIRHVTTIRDDKVQVDVDKDNLDRFTDIPFET